MSATEHIGEWMRRWDKGHWTDPSALYNPEELPDKQLKIKRFLHKQWRSSDRPTARRGLTLKHRYRLERFLCRGGQAELWLGVDQKTGEQCTIRLKITWNKSRFCSHAAQLQAVSHPHLLTTLDYGCDAVYCFTVHPHFKYTLYEYVKGQEGRRLHWIEATHMLGALARALHRLHRFWLHRDINPFNILCDEAGNVALADFDLVVPRRRRYRISGFSGTPNWYAPEQAESARNKYSVRTDIYCLVQVYWFMLTGMNLFEGTSEEEVLAKIRDVPADNPGDFVTTLPYEIGVFCNSNLKKDSDQRYSSAKEVAEWADHIIEKKRTAHTVDTRWPRLKKWRRRLKVAGAVVLVSAILFQLFAPPGRYMVQFEGDNWDGIMLLHEGPHGLKNAGFYRTRVSGEPVTIDIPVMNFIITDAPPAEATLLYTSSPLGLQRCYRTEGRPTSRDAGKLDYE